ncbi:ABC transporter permease [Hymenobacter busanensis]|uniref:ABC transporter permease n=1 Tax=Hymenobacter busanensis TaxID=2607656 RepID=A0A7L4ZWE4_9BACT|nr:ABC transporter permease [Hymenobacter busanensis]KAA9339713.1 ABC transporter permease [Hymenobacter busanensis]QHJ06532.1 ABC transporter permease subunit [Hymenobacter busanensis]
MLRTELRKLLPYRTVWVILVLFAVLFVGFVSAGSSFTVNGQRMGDTLYAFPELWPRLAYVAHYFTLLLGILLIILITDEFQFRTFRQQVIDGRSVGDLLVAKFAVSVGLVLFGVLVVLAAGVYFGLIRGAQAPASGAVTAQLPAVALYAVQTLGYLGLAALLAVLVRRSGAAILLFLLYVWVAEPLLRYLLLPDVIDQYMPTKVLGALTPTPGQEMLTSMVGASGDLLPSQALPIALAYTAVFWGLSYLLLRNRDL